MLNFPLMYSATPTYVPAALPVFWVQEGHLVHWVLISVPLAKTLLA